MNQTQMLIQELTQSILAIMVTAGTGYAIVFVPTAPHDILGPALGLVLGYYFTKAVTAAANAANQH